MKIYTKTGDQGYTKLGTGVAVRKNHQLVEAYGTVDELSSFIGLALSDLPSDGASEIAADLLWVQRKLFVLATVLAFPGQAGEEVAEGDLAYLEEAIDRLTNQLPPLHNFILPGGIRPAATIHVARTVCRRAERLIAGLDEAYEAREGLILPFLNRLSDYLFCAARFENYREGVNEPSATPAGPTSGAGTPNTPTPGG